MLIARVKGSGGYILADLSEDEIGRARLAGELFIGALGRVDEYRILSYYCNSCSKEIEGSPIIRSDEAREEVAKGHILMEQGEYVCRECNAIIARYKVFNKPGKDPNAIMVEGRKHYDDVSLRRVIEGRVGVFYKGNRIGLIKDVVVKGRNIWLLVEKDDSNDELVPWNAVEGIKHDGVNVKGKVCSKCRYENSILDAYCTECGNEL
ncbi:MAG: hypothetical protein QW560_06390 [Candidatus Nitrosocaldus sp.]